MDFKPRECRPGLFRCSIVGAPMGSEAPNVVRFSTVGNKKVAFFCRQFFPEIGRPGAPVVALMICTHSEFSATEVVLNFKLRRCFSVLSEFKLRSANPGSCFGSSKRGPFQHRWQGCQKSGIRAFVSSRWWLAFLNVEFRGGSGFKPRGGSELQRQGAVLQTTEM